MAADLPEKILQQITKTGLPFNGQHPFNPKLAKNKNGESILTRKAVAQGPKKGAVGYLDDQGRIWVKDRAHANVPDHWDVQIDDGADYIRVDELGNEIV